MNLYIPAGLLSAAFGCRCHPGGVQLGNGSIRSGLLSINVLWVPGGVLDQLGCDRKDLRQSNLLPVDLLVIFIFASFMSWYLVASEPGYPVGGSALLALLSRRPCCLAWAATLGRLCSLVCILGSVLGLNKWKGLPSMKVSSCGIVLLLFPCTWIWTEVPDTMQGRSGSLRLVKGNPPVQFNTCTTML